MVLARIEKKTLNASKKKKKEPVYLIPLPISTHTQTPDFIINYLITMNQNTINKNLNIHTLEW